MRPSEQFDWDKAIALFKGIPPPSLCRKGLHLLNKPETVYISKEGFRRCRACSLQSRRARPQPNKPIVVKVNDGLPRCQKGLHVLDTPESVYISPKTGHRRCRACAREAREKRSSKPKIVVESGQSSCKEEVGL